MIGRGWVWYRSIEIEVREADEGGYSFIPSCTYIYIHGQARGGGQEGLGAAEEEDAGGQGEEACHDDVNACLSVWWWVLGIWLVGRSMNVGYGMRADVFPEMRM